MAPLSRPEKEGFTRYITREPLALHTHRATVPASLDELVMRCLAKRPADRFANASELIAALAASAARGISDTGAHRVVVDASAPVASPRDSALTRGGERRRVTVVACTIDGQDTLVERLAPEQADRILAEVRAAAVAVAEQFGGIKIGRAHV